MIRDISDLNSYVSQKVSEVWPEHPLLAKFRPVLNLTFGDVGSDLLLRISTITRETPEAMGALLLPRLQTEGTFSIDRGFLNYKSDAPHWLLTVESASVLPTSMKFVALPFRREETILSSLRILAALFLQAHEAHRMGIKAEYVTPKGVRIPYDPLESQQAFIQLFEECSEPIQLEPIIKVLTDTNDTAQTVVWFSHNQLSDALRKQLLHCEARTQEKLLIRIPERFWTAGKIVDVQRDWISSIAANQESFLNLLYYLSGDLLYDEIDPATVVMQEHANTRWFIQAMVDRIVQHPAHVSGELRSNGFSPEERALVLRIKQMEAFRSLAVGEGRMVEYTGAIRDLCHRFNMFFNHPGFRVRITSGEVTAVEAEIISGTERTLRVLLKV